MKTLAEILKNRPLPEKEGMQQIWLDIHANRYFELISRPEYREPTEELKVFDPYLDFLHVERVEVLEINDALKAMGLA